MDMSFGKYKEKAVAWVLLEDPQYFAWMGNNGMSGKREYIFAMQLINIFDNKPFINARCNGRCGGQNPVTKLTLYASTYNGEYWFCDKCDPYSNGANSGKLTGIRTFAQAMAYRDSDLIIKAMASAKGVPQRKTKNALRDFFGY